MFSTNISVHNIEVMLEAYSAIKKKKSKKLCFRKAF